jgi:dihydroflavonol-4-reductase
VAQRTVFLTGATGFIGNRVARQLAARGDNLRCLVRDTSRGLFLESLGAELIPGEVTDTIALQRGLRGADIAYHIAGHYDIGPIDVRHMERVNVGGTRCFLEECARSRIPRAVHISTTAALGPIPDGLGDENSSWSGPYPSTYHRTKTEAHEAAKQAQQRGLPLIIVCPANVYGPGDNGPNGRFIRDLIRGRVPALLRDPAWLSHVHVDDVVEGMIAVGDRGLMGATYVLSGEAASINDFAERVARIAGRRPPPLRLPVTAVSIAAGLADVVSRVTRMRFTTNREAVRVAYHHRWLHSHERATREFAWTPRSLDEGLGPTVRWFVENLSVDGDGRRARSAGK